MIERTSFPIYEISSENKIAGRRPIKVVLHEIFPDSEHYQENGVSWKEEYVSENLHSVVGMSIVVEFLTDDRDEPHGHGMTDIREDDDLPLFEDATMVGHFDKAYIDTITIENESKRVLIAEGTLDEMRYPKFVAWLRENMAESYVKGSVEIVGKPEHDGRIIYSGGWKETGRVPQYYDYSGYAILGVRPADQAAIVMELNNKKTDTDKEDEKMDEKTKNELIAAISSAVTETNSKWDEFCAKQNELYAQITQLKADIEQKNADIMQLRADYEREAAERQKADAGLVEANAAKEDAEQRLVEANAKIAELENAALVAELNAALEPYTEEQREIAKDEIDAFNANPNSVEINNIVGKICTAIVAEQRSETNSLGGVDLLNLGDGNKGKDEILNETDII